MAKLFPFRPSEGPEVQSEPRLVNIDDEAADEVFAALSSDTARSILSRLYQDPATASDLADAVDTSLQNARYHLDKLQSAGLVEEVDTWYSSRGTEMTVYAPTSEPLVVAAGEEESRSVIRNALKRVVGAVGVLGIASVAIDRLARRVGPRFDEQASAPEASALGVNESTGVEATATPAGEATATDGGGAGVFAETPTPEPAGTPTRAETDTPIAGTSTPEPIGTETATPMQTPGQATGTPIEDAADTVTRAAMETASAEPTGTPVSGGAGGNASEEAYEVAARTTEAVQMANGGADGLLAGLPPGLLFFAGGLLVLTLATGWWYWSSYRPMYRD